MYALRPTVLSTLLVSSLLITWACYRQPEIPRDRPLSCTSSDPEECPTGFVCVENRICAPAECEASEDCPVGLVCARETCLPPGAVPDGGGDAEADADVVPDLGGGA